MSVWSIIRSRFSTQIIVHIVPRAMCQNQVLVNRLAVENLLEYFLYGAGGLTYVMNEHMSSPLAKASETCEILNTNSALRNHANCGSAGSFHGIVIFPTTVN